MANDNGDREALRAELDQLVAKHRELDNTITELQGSGRGDALTVSLLKRKKLSLKDRIRQIEDDLLPDIIA